MSYNLTGWHARVVSKAARPRIALSKGRGCQPRIDSEREEQSAQPARHVKAKEGEKEGEGRPCSKAIKRSPIQIRNSNKKEREKEEVEVEIPRMWPLSRARLESGTQCGRPWPNAAFVPAKNLPDFRGSFLTRRPPPPPRN